MPVDREHLYTVVGNVTRVYSPLILSHEWPTLGRLIFMVFCSSIGTIMNGFFVASFFVERSLRTVGNVFLACIGLSDLIVTALVMPTSAVVLLSGQWDILPVCQVLQLLTVASTYCYSIFFTLVSGEAYYRLCRSTEEYEMFASMKVGFISVLVFVISFCLAGAGVYLNLDYDYCTRYHYGDYEFRTTTGIVCHLIPCVFIITGLVAVSITVRRRARLQIHYKRSQQYERDYSITNLNLTAYICFVLTWVPYLIIVYKYPNTSDSKYYHCVWIGVCRSVFSSCIYSTMNRNFRRAFSNLFYYCCCKSSLSSSFHSRHRRALEYKPATGDVRVHIMHQAVSINSPQRYASSSRETQEL